ncbi:MAG: hypothetical protein JXR14_00605 [Paracoccaceae bacterium]
MTRRTCLLLAAVLLAGCTGSGTGPIYDVGSEPFSWVKAPSSVHPASDRTPRVADPVITFRLENGERKSTLVAAGEWGGREWRTGQSYLFGFDVRADPQTLGDEVVSLARLSRKSASPADIISAQLSAARGVTVMGRTCIAPSELRNWHRVEVRVKLSDRDAGYLEVFCDREPIWARTGLRTTLPPICRQSEGCDSVAPKPVKFEVQMGLMSDAGLSRPIVVEMQRLHYRRIFYVPNRVGQL